MRTVQILSSISYSLQKSDTCFIRRGDAQYWNPLAIKIENALFKCGAIPLIRIADIPKNTIIPKNSSKYNLIELVDIDGNSGLTIYRNVKGYEVDSNKFILPSKSVLFGRLRFYLKKIGLAPVESIGSTEIRPIILKDKNFTQEYLFLYLRSKFVDNIFRLRSGGSNHPRIDDFDLENLPVPTINKDVMRDVSLKIDTAIDLFSESQGKYKEAQIIIDNKLGLSKLKEAKKCGSYILWKDDVDITQSLDVAYWLGENKFFKDSIRLKEVTTEILTGRTPPWRMYSNTKGIRILKVRHLWNQGLSWDLKDRDFVHPLFYEKNKEATIKKYDILIASAAHQSSYIGKDISIVDCFPFRIDKAIASAKLNIIRPDNKKINPYVLLMFMQEDIFYNEIQRFITGQTAELYSNDLEKLPIPKKLLHKNFTESKKVETLYLDSLSLYNKSKNIINDCLIQIELEIEKII